ncbi:MAG: hypothetical protein Q8Q31_04420 [Nanoarchaeota archaeon]|nr:hypothetical protein [Nanoarchaeota archaeon]
MRKRGSNVERRDFRQSGLNRKGQVALFVIIALIIAAFIIGVFFYKKYVGEEEEKIEIENTEVISEQSQVLGSAVGECLEKLTASGLELIGLQGGYINAPVDLDKGVFRNDEGQDVVFRGNVMDVEENRAGYNEVPYWMTQDSIAIPSKQFMEEELEDYLELNIPICVDNFKSIKEKGMQVNSERIEADVSLSEFVYVKLNWPISAQDLGNNTFNFEKTEYKHPVDFQSIYKVAFTLASNELAHAYLEDHAKQLISLYSYSGGDKTEFNVPPFSLTVANQDCDAVSWTKEEVKESLIAIFYKNYPYLKIDKTNYTKIITGDSVTQGVYDSFILDYLESMPNISVDFRYAFENEMYFDISPSNGNTLTADRNAQAGIPFLPGFCNLEYRYKYSLQIPILIKIKDANSLRYQDGYQFYFPMKAYICGNQNRGCVGAPAYRSNLSLNTLFGEEVESRLYNCSDFDKGINISIKMPDLSNATKVDVTHTCTGFLNECYLGKTGNDGILKTQLPKCSNPKLIIQKLGYATIKDSPKDSYQLEEVKNYTLDVELVKAYNLLRNYYLSNGFTSINPNCTASYGSAQDLLSQTRSAVRKQDDKITLTIEGDKIQTPILIYPVQRNIKLNSGKFNVSTAYSGRVTIQPSEYEHDDDELTVSVNPSRSGDYNGLWFLGKHQFNWSPDKNSMIGDRIKFYAVVEHFSDDSMEVKTLQRKIIQEDGRLSGRITADKNCDGLNEVIDLTLNPSDYIKFIMPEFS